MRLLAAALGLAAWAGAAAAAPVTDEASAIEAAKRYTKSRCTEATPCRYKPRREGQRWNVWVEFTRRSSPAAKPQPYHGGHVILYFDREGHLVRRIEGQ